MWILVHILVIKLCDVLGKEVKSKLDQTENRNIQPTGYILTQFANHQPKLIYLTSNDKDKLVGNVESLSVESNSDESNSDESNSDESNSDESNSDESDSIESFSAEDIKDVQETTVRSTESFLASKLIPVTEKPDIEKFKELANQFFKQKKIDLKVTDSKPKPSDSEDSGEQPNQQIQPDASQAPPTKRFAPNHRYNQNAPIIFGNPFRFFGPNRRRIIRPNRPPPVYRPPVIMYNGHDLPINHKPYEVTEPSSNESEEHENEDDDESGEEDEEESSGKSKHESEENEEIEESEESEESDKSEEENHGDIKDEKGQKSSEYKTSKKHKKKDHKQFEVKDDSASEKKDHGQKSTKTDDKGGEAAYESGFNKEYGVKYNEEDRKRKGFNTDKGYNKVNKFGNGQKKKYDEEHHSNHQMKHHDNKADSHDSSNKHSDDSDSYKGDKGGKFKEQKFHKKGSKTTGYHNIFHKDEFKKVHTFYDDADHRGKWNKFGSSHEQHESDSGDSEEKGDHKSGHEEEEHGKYGRLKDGHSEDVHENYDKKHKNNKAFSNDQEYSKEKGHKSKFNKAWSSR